MRPFKPLNRTDEQIYQSIKKLCDELRAPYVIAIAGDESDMLMLDAGRTGELKTLIGMFLDGAANALMDDYGITRDEVFFNFRTYADLANKLARSGDLEVLESKRGTGPSDEIESGTTVV